MDNQDSQLITKLNKIYTSKGALNLTLGLSTGGSLLYLSWQMLKSIASGEDQVNKLIARIIVIVLVYSVLKLISMELSLSSLNSSYNNLKSTIVMGDESDNEVSDPKVVEEFLNKIINNIRFDILVLKLSITLPLTIVAVIIAIISTL